MYPSISLTLNVKNKRLTHDTQELGQSHWVHLFFSWYISPFDAKYNASSRRFILLGPTLYKHNITAIANSYRSEFHERNKLVLRPLLFYLPALSGPHYCVCVCVYICVLHMNIQHYLSIIIQLLLETIQDINYYNFIIKIVSGKTIREKEKSIF